MFGLLQVRNFCVFLIVVGIALLTGEASAQGCAGADGSGIFTGSIANAENGSICANNAALPGVMEIDIRNVDESGTIQFEIDWNDGSAPQRVNGTRTGANRYFASVQHFFPPNGGNVRCEYRPEVRLVINGTLCSANLGIPPRFVRWNTDNQITGNLNLEETATGVNEYLVCAGVETNVTFTDRSDLNCVPPDLLVGANDKRRWRRFVYGTANTITGAVRIAGVARTFPYNGVVDQSTEPTTTSGFPTPTTSIITVPATAQTGEIFEITMNYWNTCNPYPAATPVTEIARIRVVSQPPAPTATSGTFCNGTTPSNFVVNGVPAGNIVNWYRNVPGSPDRPGTLITSGTSTSLPVSSVPGWAGNTTAATYKVWASYRPNIANGLNCESPLIPITKTIREALTVATPTPSPSDQVCNGNTFTVTMPNPPTETFGGTTEYTWTGDAGVTIASTTANSATFNTNVTYTGTQRYHDRTITVTRRYTSAPNCPVTSQATVRIYRPTVGGTPSPFPDVCEGSIIGPITLTGHIGTIVRWEIDNGGGFVNYTGPASGASITPGTLADGTYRFRALVENGPCGQQYSAVETVVVTDNPSPPTAGADQAFCGSLITALSASALPAGATGTWSYVGSVPAGRPAPTFGNVNSPSSAVSITSATRAGAYTLRWTVVSGSCTFYDDVVIDFGANPDPIPAMPAIPVCGETATLAAPPPSIGTGTWTVTSSPAGGTIVFDDENSSTSGITLGTPTVYGAYTLQWRVVSGICAPVTGTVNVTFFEPFTVTAADINNICLDPVTLSPITITGTYGGGATGGAWSLTPVSGNGTVSASTVDATAKTITATYTPTLNDYNAGTPIELRLEVNNPASACVPIYENITITFDRKPLANAGTNLNNLCESFVKLNAETPPPFGATGMWSSTQAGVTFDDPTDPQTTVRGLPNPPSTTTVTWTLTSASGLCVSDPASITLTRVAIPATVYLTPVECEVIPAGDPVTTSKVLTDYESAITSLPVADRVVTWYKDGPPPLGTVVADPTVPQLNITDGQVYAALIRDINTNCSSDAFVTISIRPLPKAVDAIVALCEDTVGTGRTWNIDLADPEFRNAVTAGAVTVTWFDTEANALANTSPLATALPVITGTRRVFARVTHSSTPACWDVAALDLVVNSIPNSNEIFGRNEVCKSDAPPHPVETYQITPITGAKYYWDIPNGPGEALHFGGGTENDFYVIMQFPNKPAAPLVLSVRMELNGCSGPTINKSIVVTDRPIAPIITGPSVVCEEDEGVGFRIPPASSNFPTSTYNWEVRRASDGQLGGGFLTDGQGTDQILVNFEDEDVSVTVRESSSVCVSETTVHAVTINRRPIMLDMDQALCSDEPIGVTFQADPTSPVAIDVYNINNVAVTAGVTSLVGPTSGNGLAFDAIQGDRYENLKDVPLPVSYTVVPVSIGTTGLACPGEAEIITLNIKPEPQLDPNLNRAVCSGAETGITLTHAINTVPADGFIIEDIILSTTTGLVALTPIQTPDLTTRHPADAIRAHRWENTTGDIQTIEYKIRPYSSIVNCVGNPPTPVIVTVYPKPDVMAVVVPPICNGDLLNVDFSSPSNPDPNGSEFFWSITAKDAFMVINGATFGQGDIAGLSMTNPSETNDGVVTFEVYAKNTPAEGSCASPAQTFSVTIHKSPRALKVGPLNICSDSPGGNTYTADLTELIDDVAPDFANPDIAITWYNDDPRTNPGAVVIPPASLAAYVMTDDIPVYVQVEFVPTGCTNVGTVTYNVTPTVDFNFTHVQDLNCPGYQNGIIEVTVTSGTPAYSYSIDNSPFVDPGTSTYRFTALEGDRTYTIRVRDANNCTATKTQLIEEPDSLYVTINKHDATCFMMKDGSIEATAFGGTAPYTYTLVPGNTVTTDGIFNNLGFGIYTVRVEDAVGCPVASDPQQGTINHPEPVEITNLFVPKDAAGMAISCYGATDALIEVTAAGGSGVPYDYILTNSSDPTNPIIRNSNNLTEIFSETNTPSTPIGRGNWTIVVEDKNGCPSQPQIATILEPTELNAGIIGEDQSICTGATPQPLKELVPAYGAGGTPSYTYVWQDSINGTTWMPVSGATSATYAPPSLTYDAAFPKRYYRRIVTTTSVINGVTKTCASKGHAQIVTITVNPEPLVQFEVDDLVCQGSNVNLKITMLRGTAPISYKYATANGSTTEYGNPPVLISLPILQNETYTLSDVTDLNGCPAALIDPVQSVQIINANSNFTIDKPTICPGETVTFTWTPQSGVSYNWVFDDGTSLPIAAGAATGSIAHQYFNNSTSAAARFNVKLQAANTLITGCATETALPVIVHPSIQLSILPQDNILCSGETLVISDQSKGVNHGRWYYQELGTTNIVEEKTGPVNPVSFLMTNNTTQNPITYEVVYEAWNDANKTCYAEHKELVQVYRGVTPSFSIDPASAQQPIVAGVANFTFTNTSVPLDKNDFEYNWDFGVRDAVIVNEDGINYTVQYKDVGQPNVVLTAVNIAARAAGETCGYSTNHALDIYMPGLMAHFTATPLAACFPAEITTVNLSAGANAFFWELTSQNGTVETSTLTSPVFRILKPGKYYLRLTASYSGSSQAPSVTEPLAIEIFDSPTATFEARPTEVFVPDTELRIFNFSKRADQYSWDFDDGFTSTEFEPRHTYTLEGKYNIRLVAGFDNGDRDVNGDGVLDGHIVCYDTAYQEIIAMDGGNIKLPNAFTPNVGGSTGGTGVPGGGSFNDVFLPITQGVEEFTMQIFDRWGTLVFETRDKNTGWDGYDRNGRLMPAGVYVYKLVMRLSDGQRTTKVGDVTLIR